MDSFTDQLGEIVPSYEDLEGKFTEELQKTIKKILQKIEPISDDRINFLITRPWWKKIHNHAQKFINKYFPKTHIVPFMDHMSLISLVAMNDIFISNKGSSVLYEMEMGNCHENVHKLVKSSSDPNNHLFPFYNLHAYTGYALSEDGLWRNHSWVIGRSKTSDEKIIIETTTPRLIYMGIKL